MGLPSLTLPTGVPSTGISFLTPPMSEERLLRLGAAAESGSGVNATAARATRAGDRSFLDP
jgi:Asp-tRNA(Asn)/Glu-tRNA(Gln) amidotransferase A subunit family amidase